MKKSILVLVLLFLSVYSFCQKNNSAKNYQLGTIALESKKYKEAISFLTLSIEENPTADAFYNRAVSFINLGDSCNFCNDLQNASMYNDDEAQAYFERNCLITDTIKATADSIFEAFPGYSFTLFSRTICYEDSIYTQRNAKGEIIASVFETFPEYPGGDDARSRFLVNNVKYPADAMKDRIQGTVYLSFYIETNGKINDIKIRRSPSDILSEEAIRVVKLMPAWKPGTRKGKPVRVRFNMPLKFTLMK